jgi:hypothetical protein
MNSHHINTGFFVQIILNKNPIKVVLERVGVCYNCKVKRTSKERSGRTAHVTEKALQLSDRFCHLP